MATKHKGWTLLPATLLLACGGDDGTRHAEVGADGDAAIDVPVDVPPEDAAGDGDATDVEAEADADVPAPFRISLSVSPFTDLFTTAGVRITDGTNTARTLTEYQQLFVAHGATEVFARIGTQRAEVGGATDHSLARGLERAALARDLGLPLNPELALFGTYGDVSCQTMPEFDEYPELTVPGPWETLTVEQMIPVLRDFTALVAAELLATGVAVVVWDLGNEVDLGTAGVAPQPMPGNLCDEGEGGPGWYRAPDGVDPAIGTEDVLHLLAVLTDAQRIAWLQAHVWPHEARLLAAARDGVRSVDPDARFSTHISNSRSPEFAVSFFEAMAAGGYAVDEIGFSVYPSAVNDPSGLTRLRETVEAVRERFDVPVFLAEFGFPAAPMTTGPFVEWSHPLRNYALTEDGQAALLRDLASWGTTGPLSGIRPWAPEVFREDSAWGPMALFRQSSPFLGEARPSLDALREGVAAPDPGALQQ